MIMINIAIGKPRNFVKKKTFSDPIIVTRKKPYLVHVASQPANQQEHYQPTDAGDEHEADLPARDQASAPTSQTPGDGALLVRHDALHSLDHRRRIGL